MIQTMETMAEPADRVRANTDEEINRQIDREIGIHVTAYSQTSPEEITDRIAELDREWDIERVLEANASSLAFAGVFLALFRGRRWLLLPSLVLPFLLLHAVQGWCPPVPLLRRIGIRTRYEIDQEKYALKALRGDFAKDETVPIAEAALNSARA